MVANLNNQVKESDLDLDLSCLSELEIMSPDAVPTRTLPLPTVDEHEARVTSIDAKPLGSSVPTHSSEKVAYKKPSLVSHIGNRMECVKRGVKNRVAGFSSIAMKRFSPIHAPIRLPSSSSEAMSNAMMSISHTAPASRADPPGIPISLEDDPNYQESTSLLREWESSESCSSEDYVTPRAQQLVTGSDFQPSLENRNNVIPCDVPGFITPGVIEPGTA
jgi:hypothetical protein